MTESNPLAADDRFFAALLAADRARLAGYLTEDFLLIDVMTGSEVPANSFLDLVGSGLLVFESIEPAERQVRRYQDTAVVTGRTQMRGRYDGTAFVISSRYTHVFVKQDERWLLASGQGTPIIAGESAA